MVFIIDPYKFVASVGETSNPNANLRVSGGASWSSGAETIETLPAATEGYLGGDAYTAEHNGSANTNFAMYGFSRESDSSVTGFSGIRYACYVRMDDLRVYESGTEKDTGNAYVVGDFYGVHRSVSGVITYKRNLSTTVYTSAISDTSEMKGDFCFLGVNDRVLDITMERGNGPFNPFYDNMVNMIEY